jgi:hypothetical protein
MHLVKEVAPWHDFNCCSTDKGGYDFAPTPEDWVPFWAVFAHLCVPGGSLVMQDMVINDPTHLGPSHKTECKQKKIEASDTEPSKVIMQG